MANEQAEQTLTAQAAQALGERDKALAEKTPHLADTVPVGWEDTTWEAPTFPEEQFTIRDNSQNQEWGPFNKDDFIVDPETNIASTHYLPPGGTRHVPFVVRCLLQHGNLIECVGDDGIRTLRYIHVMQDNTLEEPEIF